MEFRHDYDCNELPCLVDFLHPDAFRVMQAGNISEEEIRAKLSIREDMAPENVDIFTKLVKAVHDDERNYSKNLFSYGNNRGEIVDRMGRFVASCETCQGFYGKFLDAQVVDSQKNSELHRGPYHNREEADFDFLNIGPSVNHW